MLNISLEAPQGKMLRDSTVFFVDEEVIHA